jgi:hypothetical protein
MVGTAESHDERWSLFVRVGNVSDPGPVGQRMPRSRTSVLTPALPRRRAVTLPPKPEPITTACLRSSLTATLPLIDALTGLATLAAAIPAAAPRNPRLDRPPMLSTFRPTARARSRARHEPDH